MGVAAYNRGSNLIAQHADDDKRPVEFEIMDQLNGLAKYPDAGRPFGPIHFVKGNCGFWAMCPVTGFGFWYRTLREAVCRWRVQITGYDNGAWIAERN